MSNKNKINGLQIVFIFFKDFYLSDLKSRPRLYDFCRSTLLSDKLFDFCRISVDAGTTENEQLLRQYLPLIISRTYSFSLITSSTLFLSSLHLILALLLDEAQAVATSIVRLLFSIKFGIAEEQKSKDPIKWDAQLRGGFEYVISTNLLYVLPHRQPF